MTKTRATRPKRAARPKVQIRRVGTKSGCGIYEITAPAGVPGAEAFEPLRARGRRDARGMAMGVAHRLYGECWSRAEYLIEWLGPGVGTEWQRRRLSPRWDALQDILRAYS